VFRYPGVSAVSQTTDAYRESVPGIQTTAASQSVASSQQYETEMKVAIDRQAGEQIAGVNAGAGQAIGGYQRGAAEDRMGVEKNYQMESGANKQIYVTQVDAAGQIRNAGLEAAKLRQAAAVITQVGERFQEKSAKECGYVFEGTSTRRTRLAKARVISDN